MIRSRYTGIRLHLEAVPNFAEGFITFHFKPYHTQVLPYAIGIPHECRVHIMARLHICSVETRLQGNMY